MAEVKAFMLASKAWQIFVLLCVVPFVAMFAAMFSQSMFSYVLVGAAFMLLIQTWYWSMGSFLNSILDIHLRLSSTKLIFSVLYPVFYISVFFWLIMKPGMPGPELIVPLHLLAMFCMFYEMYFVAKALTMVERGGIVSISEYVPTFLLLWFYPIGIWIVQPQVSRLYQSNHQNALMTPS